MAHSLRHEALPYSGREQFVTACVTQLRDALDRDERLILLAPRTQVDDVRQGLEDDVDSVALIATDEHARNPTRVMTLLDSFRLAGDGRRAFAVSTALSHQRTPAGSAEADYVESLYNDRGLQHWSLSLVCMVDEATMRNGGRMRVRRAHPVIRGEDAENDDYDPGLTAEVYSSALPPPPPDARTLAVVGAELARMRAFVRTGAAECLVAPDRVEDLVLATNEIVTNSLRHGGGRCTVLLWCDGTSAVCQVHDDGHFDDLLVGRLSPPVDASSGRGLWLANHLCDLVQIRSSGAGTVVRLFVDRP